MVRSLFLENEDKSSNNKSDSTSFLSSKINDGEVSADQTWSSQKISNKFDEISIDQSLDENSTRAISNKAVSEKVKEISEQIGDLTVGDNAITTEKIADEAVNASKIATASISTDKIVDNAVTASKVAANAITTEKISNLAVTTAKIGAGAITSDKIADGSITKEKLAAGATDVADGGIAEKHLASNSVTSDKIKDAAVTSTKIANEAITSDKLAASAVTSQKISSGAITSDKIDGYAVTNGKLANSAVTATKIANSAVESNKIAPNAVTTEKVVDNAITLAKLATDVTETLTSMSGVAALSTQVETMKLEALGYGNGLGYGEDGKLYLTHDGSTTGLGVEVAGGSGGMAFDSGYQDESGYIHLTSNGEDVEAFTPFKVAGGGGGGGTVGSKLVFAMYSPSAFSVLKTASSADIKFRFKSTDAETGSETGAGQLSIFIGGILKDTRTITQGDSTVDVLSLLSPGANSIKLVMTDSYGAQATRNITITVETFTVEWNLGNTEKNTGNLAIYVTPTGSGAKILHLLVDGVEKETKTVTTTGRRIDFSVPLSIGSHTISVYGTMSLSGILLTSDTLTCQVAQISDTSSSTVIAAKLTKTEFDQYSTILIPYRIINSKKNPVTASFYVNDILVNTEAVDQSEHTWSYRASNAGKLKLRISAEEATWEKELTINNLSSEISEVSDNLILKIDPNTIKDLDSFEYSGITFTTSKNFDTYNGGLQLDNEGNRCLKVMKGDRLTINHNLFGTDARANGKNIKFIYKIENASDFNGEAISCMNNDIGLSIAANSASIQTEQTSMVLPTCEGYKTELELNIEPDSANKLMMFWEQGTPSRVTTYAVNDNFKQPNPVGITIGSDSCDVVIYMVRVYGRDLTKDETKANFIADGANATEIMNRHDRNMVYDSAGNLDPDLVATLNPNLHVLTWHAANFSTAKSQKITGTLTHKFTSGGSAHSWTAQGVEQKAQGTSSLGYVDAGCNEDFNLINGIVLEDGTAQATYSMTDNSVGVNYFNFKTNVASQEHINNILLSDWYNTYQPYERQAKKDNPKVRDTVEGHMAVLFFHNTGSEVVVMGGIEVQPDETVLYSLGCLNNSKKNENVFKYDDIVVELRNNISDQVRFKSDDLSGEDYSGDMNFEFRYLNEDAYTKEEAGAKFQEFLSWVVSCDDTSATNSALGSTAIFNGKSYTVDSAEYRRAKFRAEASKYMELDSFLYHYLFTLVFSQVDNRAKNVFIAYNGSKWNVCFSYDNDTAMGNDNEGGLTLKYGYMDTDSIGSKNVFNAADSALWNMIRVCFPNELQSMYVDRENAGAWNLDTFAQICDTNQDYACESLWIDDVWRKDINTYTYIGTSAYLPMLNGKKRLQRRNFLHYQRPFMSSYFLAPFALSDSATIRGYTPTTWGGVKPESKMTITPYSDLWVTVKAGSTNVQKRAYAGQPVELSLGNSAMNDTEIYVRCASFIADLGDLACLYPGYIDISACGRLQKAIIGSSVEGYSNTNMTSATFKNATSLTYVNLENCPNLTQELDLSNNINVREVYTRGSGITGITFARHGRVQTALLNAIASVYAIDLRDVEKFTLEDYSNLKSINAVNSTIDTLGLITKADNLVRVRLKDIAWETTVSAYNNLIKLSKIDGIDDDGYNIDTPVVTGTIYFDSIGKTKRDNLAKALPDVTITYGSELEEHVVRFLNEDKTVLFTDRVEHNGAAIDPITAGLIEVPTKASDIDYNYTYYKWNASLDNVAADIDYIATYTKSDRYNTVRFMDGDNVLETYTIKARQGCSYKGDDLVRAGYVWTGWDKDTSNVIEDMDVKATYIYPTLPSEVKDMSRYDYAYSDDPSDKSAYTFAEFYSIQKMGQTADYFPIGTKCKYVTENDSDANHIIIFELHSYGHYELTNGSMSNADWYMVGVLSGERSMDSSGTNKNGWNGCTVRNYLNNELYKSMPPRWRNLIAPSITLTTAGNNSSNIVKSTDYFRLPSVAEVGFHADAYPYNKEVSAEAKEITFSLYTDYTSRIKKDFNGEGVAHMWYLRSPVPSTTACYYVVAQEGGYVYETIAAYNTAGICAGFSV